MQPVVSFFNRTISFQLFERTKLKMLGKFFFPLPVCRIVTLLTSLDLCSLQIPDVSEKSNDRFPLVDNHI